MSPPDSVGGSVKTRRVALGPTSRRGRDRSISAPLPPLAALALMVVVSPIVSFTRACPYPGFPGSSPIPASAHPVPDGHGVARVFDDDHRDDDPRYTWYDLLHVELRLVLDVPARRIAGEVSFDTRSRRDRCSEILLDLVDSLRVTEVTWEGSPVTFEHSRRLLRLFPDPPLGREEEARFTVRYDGHPPRDGMLGLAFEEQGDPPRPLVSTLSETHAAAGWWPCKNITWDKFTLDAFFTVPEPLAVISNGILIGVAPGPGGTRTYHWREDYPIATYLVFLSATEYVSWGDVYRTADSSFTVPIMYYAYPGSEARARAAWARTPEMIGALAARFGEYPFPREKYGIAEFNWGGAMEHQTCTSYGTYNLIYSVASNERVMAHELAHQWWGDLVSPATWDDMWLNEGFAVYGEAVWAEHLGGRAGYTAYMRDIGGHSFDGPLMPPIYRFSATVYFKGGWVLHMLRGVLGDSTFFHTLGEYQKAYAHGPASTEGLQTICERSSGRDLQDFFSSWVYGSGMPVYEAVWTWRPEGSNGGGSVALELRQVQNEPVFVMPLPIVFNFSAAPPETLVTWNSAREEAFTFRFDRCPDEMQVDPEDWVLKRISWIRGPTGVSEPAGSGSPRRGLTVVPNPSSGPVEIRWTGPADERAHAWGGPFGAPAGGIAVLPMPDGRRLVIADAAGRRVRLLAAPAGRPDEAAVLPWDGRDEDGQEVPAGVYWIKAPETPGPGARVVRIR